MRLVYDGTSRSPIKKKPLGEPCGFGRLANESAEEAALVAARLDDEDLVLDARLATRRLALLALLDLVEPGPRGLLGFAFGIILAVERVGRTLEGIVALEFPLAGDRGGSAVRFVLELDHDSHQLVIDGRSLAEVDVAILPRPADHAGLPAGVEHPLEQLVRYELLRFLVVTFLSEGIDPLVGVGEVNREALLDILDRIALRLGDVGDLDRDLRKFVLVRFAHGSHSCICVFPFSELS